MDKGRWVCIVNASLNGAGLHLHDPSQLRALFYGPVLLQMHVTEASKGRWHRYHAMLKSATEVRLKIARALQAPVQTHRLQGCLLLLPLHVPYFMCICRQCACQKADLLRKVRSQKSRQSNASGRSKVHQSVAPAPCQREQMPQRMMTVFCSTRWAPSASAPLVRLPCWATSSCLWHNLADGIWE